MCDRVFSPRSRPCARKSGDGRQSASALRTSSGMGISRWALISCSMSAIGNSGARSCGPMGCLVPGCSTGAGGVFTSARMLYQKRGICSSLSKYLVVIAHLGGSGASDEENANVALAQATPRCAVCCASRRLGDGPHVPIWDAVEVEVEVECLRPRAARRSRHLIGDGVEGGVEILGDAAVRARRLQDGASR